MEKEPPIYYVPGAENHYKTSHDVIVLDEELKDYTEAHDYILNHELQHAEDKHQTFLGFLFLELKTDIHHCFSTDETLQEVRRYYDERSDSGPVSYAYANSIRALLGFVLFPAGSLYRKISSLTAEVCR